MTEEWTSNALTQWLIGKLVLYIILKFCHKNGYEWYKQYSKQVCSSRLPYYLMHICASQWVCMFEFQQNRVTISSNQVSQTNPVSLRSWCLQFEALAAGMLFSINKQHVVCCVSLQTAATVTVGRVSVMKAGPEMPASSRRSVTSQTRRAGSCAKTPRGWCAPTEVLPSHRHTHTHNAS